LKAGYRIGIEKEKVRETICSRRIKAVNIFSFDVLIIRAEFQAVRADDPS
jgi:hypothetical protein